MNRPFAPLFILACLSSTLVACGGGSSTPPPPPPAISVSFSTPPPASMALSATAPVAVTVSNDSANAGVTFSCAPAGACGTFTAITSTTATYNAPAAVPTGGVVTVTATSVTDTTKSAHSGITINGPAITITISVAPPATLSTAAPNNTAVIAATTSDPAGVNWTCTPAASCGAFNPTSTLTTATTTYTAPTAVPTGGSVTIIATSKTDSTKSAQAAVTITGSASLASLKGQYAFLVLSPTGSRGSAAWVGSVNLDGTGKLGAVGTTTFAGVEDVVSPVRNDQADNIYTTAANAASKYTIDASGHGQIIMATVRGELMTISFVITSANFAKVATHAEIIEADGSGGEAGDPGSGTLDLQDPTAFSNASLAHTYSFTMTGVQNAANNPPESLGGVLNLSVPTSITGNVDIVSGGTVVSSAAGIGSQIEPNGSPDANGRGTFHVVLPGASTTRSLTYYVVTSKVLRVFENSNISFTGGSMFSQGSAGTSLSGSFVYQHSGWSTAGRTVAAGQFNVTAPSTTVSGGISDANSGGLSAVTPSTSKAVSGSYTVPVSEPGTISLALTDAAQSTASTFNAYPVDPTINLLDPNNSSGGGGALLLHTDANINGVGILLPQSAPQALALNYAVNLINAIAASTPNEIDLVGVLTAASTVFAGANDLADYTDASPTPNPMIGAPISGTYTADTVHAGRYTGTLTVGVPPAAITPYPYIPGTTAPVTFNVAIYQATTSQAFVVETDNKAITTGQMVQQVLP